MIAALSVYNCIYVEEWRGKLLYHDGDTFRCRGDVRPIAPDVELWTPKVRLVRIDAPEQGNDGAEFARSQLAAWLSTSNFNLICYGRDKYGRLLADAERGTGLLSQHMLDSGLAQPMSLDSARNLVGEDTDPRTIAYSSYREGR